MANDLDSFSRSLPAPLSEAAERERRIMRESVEKLETLAMRGDLESLKAVGEMYRKERYLRLLAQMDDDET